MAVQLNDAHRYAQQSYELVASDNDRIVKFDFYEGTQSMRVRACVDSNELVSA